MRATQHDRTVSALRKARNEGLAVEGEYSALYSFGKVSARAYGGAAAVFLHQRGKRGAGAGGARCQHKIIASPLPRLSEGGLYAEYGEAVSFSQRGYAPRSNRVTGNHGGRRTAGGDFAEHAFDEGLNFTLAEVAVRHVEVIGKIIKIDLRQPADARVEKIEAAYAAIEKADERASAAVGAFHTE